MAKKSANARYEARNRKMRSDYKKETGKTLGERQTKGKGSLEFLLLVGLLV